MRRADLLRHRLEVVARRVHAPSGRELRVGHPRGADRIAPDVEGGALDGHRTGELVHRTLGGSVDPTSPRHQPRDGAGVEDHSTATLGLELEHRVLAPDEDAARSRPTSATTTFASSSAKRSADARPTPDPEPMTTADLPCSNMLTLLRSRRRSRGAARPWDTPAPRCGSHRGDHPPGRPPPPWS